MAPELHEVDLTGGAVRLAGIIDVERTPDGIVPHRLPLALDHQIVDPALRFLRTMPSGGRLELRTDATQIELDVQLTLLQLGDQPVLPAAFDLVIDGELADAHRTIDGTVLVVDQATGGFEFRVGGPTTVRFAGLPARDKTVELWLPHAAAVELRALRADAAVRGPAPAELPRWVHYGSSISHCLEADRPTGVWPVVAARAAGVDLRSLGLAGQCHLDQFVARTVRDLPLDLFSMKVGINVVNGDTMRERTFVPAVHGFLDTVRDGHPDVPIVLVTPIICPAHEDQPGPSVPGPDGYRRHIERPPGLRVGALSLRRIRTLLREVVEARRAAGDPHLHLLEGTELFGEHDLDDLPDGLHPNAVGYERMGDRFHAWAWGDGGPFHTA